MRFAGGEKTPNPWHFHFQMPFAFDVSSGFVVGCKVNVTMQIEVEREDDGRWIAGIPDLPGVMVYGQSQPEAVSKVKAMALRVLADRLEHGESIPELMEIFSVDA